MGVRLVITGGGTGGHLFPGIAVADELLARYPGSEVLFIGTGREIDRRGLQGKPYRQAVLTGSGLKGISWRGRLVSLARIPVGFAQAFRLLREFRPDLVLGVGGYVTGPVLLAARCLGITACIHEQNSVPGLANRLLGRFVDYIFLSLPDSGGYFPAAKTRLVGNPLRRELVAAALNQAPNPPRQAAASRGAASIGDNPAAGPTTGLSPVTPQGDGDPSGLAGSPGLPRVLVLGGSQGAHRVNLLLAEAARLLAAEGLEFEVMHQSGPADREVLAAEYRRAGIKARVEAFISEMAPQYLAADLVVSRAGATTLAELALFGKAALLIPYPFAADDHQRLNAEVMVRQGAARLLPEQALQARELADQIKELLQDKPARELMGRQARELARPEAAAAIIAASLTCKCERTNQP